MSTTAFLTELWDFYNQHARQLPWRSPSENGYSLYAVAVSELMLQQTQVDRVVPKYHAFMEAYPTAAALARASRAEVIAAWNGLGYNRRALYLHDWAKWVVANGEPASYQQLQEHKGFGENTAKAVFVYAQNQPLCFIETNIRTVLLNHFFASQDAVSDKEMLHLLESLLDRQRPREFYWALMDYGSWLKKQGKGLLQRSATYKKQAPFSGSVRQLRGKVLRLLQQKDAWQLSDLSQALSDDRLERCLQALEAEGFINRHDEQISLSI